MPTAAGAGLTSLVPLRELAPGVAAAIRTQVTTALLAQAARELGIAQERLVVRDIRPAGDLGYTNEDWVALTGATANAYETMTTGTMATNRYVGMYGAKDDSPFPGSVTLLKLNVGGADRAVWSLVPLTTRDGYIGFSPSAVVITPNAPYTISRYVVRTGMGAHIVLKGVVVEPRGKVVSP